MEPKQNNSVVTILSVLLLISVFIAGFFAYRTQSLVKEITKLRTPPVPVITATPTPDPTTDWKTYTDDTLNISFQYPGNLTFKILENGVVNFLDSQNEFVFNFNGIQDFTELEFTNYKFIEPKELIDKMGRKWKTHLIYAEVYNYEAFSENSEKITQVSFQGKTKSVESLSNLILSTFKFIEPVVSSSPVVCTMDAKLCDDGSYVGRSGPKCEFAPCTTPKN
jgi:hypothetical protein